MIELINLPVDESDIVRDSCFFTFEYLTVENSC